MEEILKESQDIVDEICEKYGYDSEDKEGNDSLRTVLLKAIPKMLKNAKPKDRELFYQMIRHTPIVITENLTKEGHDKLVEQYIGNINPHIVEGEKANWREYGKTIGDGAYVSVPIIDENMQVQGKKSFIYIQRVAGQVKEFLGTDINVPQLEHELGHAWNAEMGQYVIQEDGTLKERVGTAERIYSFSKGENGKLVQKLERVTGIMIEESMNTIAEEDAMAEYMGLTLEEMEKAYNSPLIRSKYQGYMSGATRYMLQKLNKEDFKCWRLYGDVESKERIEDLMSKTEYWRHRELDILPNSDSPRSYDKKREIISKEKNSNVQEFFEKYEDVYFPDISQMTPLEKIENVLEQSYTMHVAKYNMEFDNYNALLECMNWEIYSLINQAASLKIEKELTNTISNVRLSEVNKLVQETKALARQEEQTLGKNTKEEGVNR